MNKINFEVIKIRLSIHSEDGVFSYSNLSIEADNEELYALARAINSLQLTPAESFVKVVRRRVELSA
ncbi:MAG: hypothetical protein LBQ68_02880 [Clostridiales bacterium]|nr:hypothetical protein [Clostridiales bacterium]